jgi:hypothetical protein
MPIKIEILFQRNITMNHEILVKLFLKASALTERWRAILGMLVFQVVYSPIATFTTFHSPQGVFRTPE